MHTRHYSSLLAFVAWFAAATSALAQQVPELPAPSPKARVEQRVGLTDFAVEYSSPGVKARKIWGGLVPYDTPWRTGANAPTRLTSSRDFVFAGKAVPAGSYALYTIPTSADFTVVLSNSTESWNGGFPATTEVARVTLKPSSLVRPRERMTFLFSETTDDATRLDLEWERLRLSIPIQVATGTHAMANIDKAVDDAWRPHFAAARYLLDSKGDLKKALAYVDASIAIKATWWNHLVRARILGDQGKTANAIATAAKAKELGKGDRVFEGFFQAELDGLVEGWKKSKR